MKKALILCLIFCTILSPFTTVFAESNDTASATLRDVYDLQIYAQRFPQLFYIEGESSPFNTMYLLDVADSDNKGADFLPLLEQIAELKAGMTDQDSEITVEQLKGYYDSLDNLARAYTIDKQELEILLDRCEPETNTNTYYPDNLWADFIAAKETAFEVYGDDTITDLRVSDAYWTLRFAYDALCAVNPLAGDVDFDGEANVIDVTIIQRYCAEFITLNSSQCIVGTLNDLASHTDLDITDATILQRYLVNLIPEINSHYLSNLTTPAYRGRIACNNTYFMNYRYQWIMNQYFS